MTTIRLLTVLMFVLVLAACGTQTVDDGVAEWTVVDGASDSAVSMIRYKGVDCIIYDGYESGGIDCNWERYNGN